MQSPKQDEPNSEENARGWFRLNKHPAVLNTQLMACSLVPLTVASYYYENRGGKLPTLLHIYWRNLTFRGLILPIKDLLRRSFMKHEGNVITQSMGGQLFYNFVSAALSTVIVNALHINFRQDAYTRMMSARPVSDATKLKKYYKDYNKSILLQWRDLLRMYNAGAMMRMSASALSYGLTFCIFDTVQPLLSPIIQYLVLPNLLMGSVLILVSNILVSPLHWLAELKRKLKVSRKWETNFIVEYEPYSTLASKIKFRDAWINSNLPYSSAMKYRCANAIQFGILVAFYQCFKQYSNTDKIANAD